MCTPLQVGDDDDDWGLKLISWKVTEFYYFEGQCWPCFILFLGFSCFSFSNVVQFGPFKKMFLRHFVFFTKKMTLITCIIPPKSKIFSLFYTWGFADLDLKCVHWILRMVCMSSADTMHTDLLTFFYFWKVIVAGKQNVANRQTFLFWPDFWRWWFRGQQHTGCPKSFATS